jgi:hypothetical protein
MLNVIRTREAGSRYRLAIKYNCEVSSDMMFNEFKIAGIR